MTDLIDIAIVGAGPAGLTAALHSVRQRFSCLIFDSGEFRNTTGEFYTIPGYDQVDPAKFRADCREQLTKRYGKYSIFVDKKVEKITKDDDEKGCFTLVDADGKTWRSKKVVLATGIDDTLPDLEGYDKCWPKRIFNCLYCQGYEEADCKSAGVLAIPGMAKARGWSGQSKMALRLADKVTIYTNGNDESVKELEALIYADKVTIDNREIARLEPGPSPRGEVILHFKDGTSATEGFLSHNPHGSVRGPFHKDLGLTLGDDAAEIKIDEMGVTNVKGVFAAGDNSTPFRAASAAINAGAMAGIMANVEIIREIYPSPPAPEEPAKAPEATTEAEAK